MTEDLAKVRFERDPIYRGQGRVAIASEALEVTREVVSRLREGNLLRILVDGTWYRGELGRNAEGRFDDLGHVELFDGPLQVDRVELLPWEVWR